MTLLYRDALFQRHDTGRHPENAGRLRSIESRLEEAGLVARCTTGTYQPLREQQVARVHDPLQVQLVKRTAESGGGYLDPDSPVCPASFEAALAAAGACVSAVDAVLRGTDTNALCLVRPPGHHATQARSMGFCLFNNVALAVCHARDAHQINRILVVDWDVHHGNGTQDVFYNDETVGFYSIHRYGRGFYPGSGAGDETGSGSGLGYTFNAPVKFGTPRRDYLAYFAGVLEKAADKLRPELVLLSAGFDAHVRDPIGSLGLEVEDFADMTRMVLDVARTHAGGRLVSCLEGGYNLQALAESVEAHLTGLLADGARPE